MSFPSRARRVSTASPDARIWAAALGLLAMILVVPRLGPGAAAAAWLFFSRVCHQDPERSLILFGSTLPVCARCFGIYCGAVVGSLWPPHRALGVRLLAMAVALNVVDVVAEMLGWHANIASARVMLGMFLGFAVAAVIARAASRATTVAERTPFLPADTR